jgi:PAS domain S-box-containing protein
MRVIDMPARNLGALAHSLPVLERHQRFDQGTHFEWSHSVSLNMLAGQEALTAQGIGTWECDLSNNALTWSPAVYDLFGLPQGKAANRKKTVTLYREESRVKMERLRAYAIKHLKGFTLDAEIVPANGGRRWIRLVATPVCIDQRTVRLSGFKRDVTHEYF